MVRVFESKFREFTAALRAMVEALANVQAAEFTVTVSAEASPMVKAPSSLVVPATSRAKPGLVIPIPTLPSTMRPLAGAAPVMYVPEPTPMPPETERADPGLVSPMPTLLFEASMVRVFESKFREFTAALRAMVEALANVQAAEFTVTVSAEASPMVKAPLILAVSFTSRPKPGLVMAMPTLPAKYESAVPGM